MATTPRSKSIYLIVADIAFFIPRVRMANKIKSMSEYVVKVTTGVWLVDIDKEGVTAESIYEDLRPYIRPYDNVLIIRVADDFAGWTWTHVMEWLETSSHNKDFG